MRGPAGLGLAWPACAGETDAGSARPTTRPQPRPHSCRRRLLSTRPAGSAKGKAILADWSNELPKFWQLVPPSEANSPQASKAADEAAQAGSAVAAGVAVAASA